MRRTYRSKKDDGSIDPKGLITKIDARSSAFDNFYIHNIKLNKKELFPSACSNQINAASKKIRKRKYVKRIVNDVSQRAVPHSAEPGTQSVLLTPDKSIHVNKAPDPFDLLLRSSPTFSQSPMLIKKSREKPNIKKKTKFNSSNAECEDWNNENATTKVNSLCQSTSDVRSHRLRVEVEGTGNRKCHDESISRIVRIMPLLNDNNKDAHRLTATYRNSPAAGNSPLCSTPFQLKYRCKSIFNISPISNNFNESSKVVMKSLNRSSLLDEDVNASQCESSVQKQSSLGANTTNREGIQTKSKDPINGQASFECKKQASLESKQLNTFSTSELEPCYGFSKVALIDNINQNTDHIRNYLETHVHNISVPNKSYKTSSEFKNKKFDQIEDECLRSSSDCLLSDSLPYKKVNTKKECASKNRHCTSSNKDYMHSNLLTSPETASPCNKTNYIQCKSNNGLLNHNNSLCNPNLVVTLEKMNDSIFYKYYTKYKSTETIRHQSKVFKDLTNLEQRDNFIELVNVSYNTDFSNNLEDNALNNTDYGNNLEEKDYLIELSNTSYNTDYGNILEEKENLTGLSDVSYNIDGGNNLGEKENFIELSNTSCDIDGGNNLEEKENLIYLSNASCNIDCSNNLEEKENFELSNVSYNTDPGNFYSMDYFSPEKTNQEFQQIRETNETHKEGAGISYVTTRRRHEVINNSIIISPDKSYGDVSTSCNNLIELTENQKSNVTSVQEGAERGIVSTSNESAADSIVSKHEDILLRDHIHNSRGSICHIGSNNTRERDDTKLTGCNTLSGSKVAIVLQPGKKWERSLSIYKRMTTIADTDHSLLDCEQMERKGRKYRQSVIDTMQMQKSFCSLHNEPINGRRSTFICKPSRSTIKLVKSSTVQF
ncbi:PREDICTED: probable serine/threonine-protein kinase clkA isoform X2 [Papilio polytes]|uniref:probable serine/threonine-protein kinase clkA isoform X2 n=1 Tax=Papilio polytes TaxID=76194 RepID=UPI000675C269|nr:PREDICTED: probable serine/threonine-protein kinase clkA isoform X2 [Papilio polytes]